MSEALPAAAAPTVALLPWSNVVEDFLDAIEVPFERFRDEMTGGWLFGYVEALWREGIHSAVVCWSARRDWVGRHVHRPTGATLLVLPAGAAYRAAARRMADPYATSFERAFGPRTGSRATRPLLRALRHAAPYLATPPRGLARALRAERCAAVLCQEYEYARFDVCVAVGRALGIPVFATFQGGDWRTSALERPIRPLALRAAAGLVIATAREAERVRARYRLPADRIARIFNPLDLALWRPDDAPRARAALDLPRDARVAVWHGRVDLRRKGLDVLVDAWARLRGMHPGADWRLLLVGTGPDAGALRAALAALPAGEVRWIDEYLLDRDAMRRLLAAADVAVLPSRHEGFPVAPVEAMACGLPVVAADAPGVADIFERGEAHGGIVVPREDPAALAAALARLLGDTRLSAALGRRALARAHDAFSLESVGRALRGFLTARGARLLPRA